jgi:transposase
VHLAHPLGVKAFEYRRVKNDFRDAQDLADLLPMGRLPDAWIAPPATRELRELVRHRAKLVGLRSHCKAEVHAVLAKCGVQVPMSDLFGLWGTELLDGLDLPAPYAAKIASLRRLMDDVDFEVNLFADIIRWRMAKESGYTAVQKIPGIGPTLGAVLVAEIGDIRRFASAEKLTCWAGLTPKHHEFDTHVHRGRITKQGSRLVRWAAIESVKTVPKTRRGPAPRGNPGGQGRQTGVALGLQLRLRGAVTLHRSGCRAHLVGGEHQGAGPPALGVAQHRRLVRRLTVHAVAGRFPAAPALGDHRAADHPRRRGRSFRSHRRPASHLLVSH